MTLKPTQRQLARLETQLVNLRDGALKLEQTYAKEVAQIEPGHRASAKNFLHYLSIRQHDIRGLQQDLASLGLSSLGLLEPHTMASLNAVIGILEQLTGKTFGEMLEVPADFRTGPLLLRDHTRGLLGPEPSGRLVRIMVTMPSEAATNPQLVEDLLLAGMDVMRINCAHDDADAWAAMVENLRQAFENLPRILLASLHAPPVGVMIDRGDLAVEVGFERLSEVQQEILWICEAAHVPVIWATQILEGMAKKGAPSRAEVSDATMSIQAECAMLNKGPNIVETVRF